MSGALGGCNRCGGALWAVGRGLCEACQVAADENEATKALGECLAAWAAHSDLTERDVAKLLYIGVDDVAVLVANDVLAPPSHIDTTTGDWLWDSGAQAALGASLANFKILDGAKRVGSLQ